jgi:hypothetical protein
MREWGNDPIFYDFFWRNSEGVLFRLGLKLISFCRVTMRVNFARIKSTERQQQATFVKQEHNNREIFATEGDSLKLQYRKPVGNTWKNSKNRGSSKNDVCHSVQHSSVKNIPPPSRRHGALPLSTSY